MRSISRGGDKQAQSRRGEHEVSRNPSRRESRNAPVTPVVRPPVLFICTGPMGAIGTRLSLRPLRVEGETRCRTRAGYVARAWMYDSRVGPHTQCRPGAGRDPTTNGNSCATLGPQPSPTTRPYGYGSLAFAGTTIVDAGRATHSVSSWRKPGPITPILSCCARSGHDPVHHRMRWLWILAFARMTHGASRALVRPTAKTKTPPRRRRFAFDREGDPEADFSPS